MIILKSYESYKYRGFKLFIVCLRDSKILLKSILGVPSNRTNRYRSFAELAPKLEWMIPIQNVLPLRPIKSSDLKFRKAVMLLHILLFQHQLYKWNNIINIAWNNMVCCWIWKWKNIYSYIKLIHFIKIDCLIFKKFSTNHSILMIKIEKFIFFFLLSFEAILTSKHYSLVTFWYVY